MGREGATEFDHWQWSVLTRSHFTNHRSSELHASVLVRCFGISEENAGKTTLVNALATGNFDEDLIPTVGFNMRKVKKGAVSMKLWDLGGQPRFRSMWERYCRGANAILFVVDGADSTCNKQARQELQSLLSKPSLAGIPLLVLANKNDLPFAANEKEVISDMMLDSIKDRQVSCFSISAKNKINIDTVTRWLLHLS